MLAYSLKLKRRNKGRLRLSESWVIIYNSSKFIERLSHAKRHI